MTTGHLSLLRVTFVTLVVCLAHSTAVRAAGGDTCTSATIIREVPFTDDGTTVQATDNYRGACGQANGARDVVYMYTSPSDQCVVVSLCQTPTFDSVLYVFSGSTGGCPPSGQAGTTVACSNGGCTGSTAARIGNLTLSAGDTYWFAVDGNGDAGGTYHLDISPCQPLAACCTNGTCTQVTEAQCSNQNGTWIASIGYCTDQLCATGACCRSPSTCEDNAGAGISRTSCESSGGTFLAGLRCQAAACGSAKCRVNSFCNDGQPCTSDTCNLVAGTCTHQRIAGCCATDGYCDDHLYCNGQEYCSSGTCHSGTAITCNDNNPCTMDSCDEVRDRCIHTPVANCCRTNSDCDDNVDCTLDSCNAATGACTHANAPPSIPCGDRTDTECSNPDTCGANGSCQPNHAAGGTPCGNSAVTSCTLADACDGAGACNPRHRPDGTPCDDGDTCTSGDACVSGICRGQADGTCSTGERSFDPSDPVNQVSFQALLTDASGTPLTAPTVNLVIRFYNSQGTGVGQPISLSNVPLQHGLVSTGLPVPFSVFSGEASLIGVSINGTSELQPRIPIRSSFQAINASYISGGEIVEHLRLGGKANKGGAIELLDATGSVAATFTTATEGGTTFRLGSSGQSTAAFSGSDVTLDTGGSLPCEDDPFPPPGAISSHPQISATSRTGTKTFQVFAGCDNGDDGAKAVLASSNLAGRIVLDASYKPSMYLSGDSYVSLSAGSGGTITIGSSAWSGDTTLKLGGDWNGTGRGYVETHILKVKGGADVSELFNLESAEDQAIPGYLVSLDPRHPGSLVIARSAYDQRVAGVISGAGGVETGVLLGQEGTLADGKLPIALSGRVYCWADAGYGAIEVGDLLTTSHTPGHAMKVQDSARTRGAIIGKAMTALDDGRALVLVLVSLQ